MEDKNLTPKESLSVISRMIESSKTRMNENGFIYLFWGWLMIICALAQFLLIQLEYYEIHYYPYYLAIPAGIYTGIYYSRESKKEQGSSFLGNLFATVWISVGLNILITAFVFSFALNMNPIPFILMFLGIATIVSGQIINFKTLVIGGVICNLLGITTIVMPFVYHPLIAALALVAADLVPGYSLRIKYKKSYA
jgi:hypothetical protein